jgi:hypothetical protein
MKLSIITLAVLLPLFFAPFATPQDSLDPLPKVIQHANPTYPPLARQTRIQGDVRVKLTTDGESVTSSEGVDGHKLLIAATVDNVRTWKFARHNPATFFVTFRYKLNSGNTDVEFLEAPGVVRIEAEPSQLSILYADIDLGTWKIEWKSRLGTSHRTVELFYNGADEEWLEGKFLDPRRAVKKDDDDEDEKSDNDSEKIDYGHREADFVAFKVNFTAQTFAKSPRSSSATLKPTKSSAHSWTIPA